jgi:DNA (cytosine-5)-methyltransferase 1
MDLQQRTGEGLRELALFAGAGGGILGGKLLGWRTVCAVEWDTYAASVLCARQNDGVLAPFPIWNDVRTFDGRPWRGRVDVVSGGFPCQDISAAGKGAGIDGARSGMWFHMARIIREVRPQYAFVENSPMLTSRGLGRVLGDLAEMGYDARWGVLGAVHAGAPHRRHRIWIVATDANSLRELQPKGIERDIGRRAGHGCEEDVADANGIGVHKDTSAGKLWPDRAKQSSAHSRTADSGEITEKQIVANSDGAHIEGGCLPCGVHSKHTDDYQCGAWWNIDPADAAEPDMGRVAYGVAARVDRLRCIGNGQVPAVAALAWTTLTN